MIQWNPRSDHHLVNEPTAHPKCAKVGWHRTDAISNFPGAMMSESESSCKKLPMENVIALWCLAGDYNATRHAADSRSLFFEMKSLQ